MRVNVQLTPDVAAALEGRGDDTAESESLRALVDELGVAIEPIYEGTSDESLMQQFLVEAEPAAADRVAATLLEHSAVDAAYVKPPASAP
jgi:hypothetical protein